MISTTVLLKYLLLALLFSGSLIIFFLAKAKARDGEFYTDVPRPLLTLGIFIWGDALVIAPFWLLSSVFLFVFQADVLNILRYTLLFWMIRSFYEVVYWINHQVAKKEYKPPLFRQISWLGSDEQGILYQLMNTCQLILFAAILAATWISPFKDYFLLLQF